MKTIAFIMFPMHPASSGRSHSLAKPLRKLFQSDHNWIMSKDTDEKKRIFNLIKINKNCNLDKDINLNNVNALRLIFSCMTGNKVKYISD